MVVYPDAIDEFRTIENLPGVTYDEEDTKTVFAEDTDNITDAIIRIESALGLNPEGSFDTVVDRLNAIYDEFYRPDATTVRTNHDLIANSLKSLSLLWAYVSSTGVAQAALYENVDDTNVQNGVAFNVKLSGRSFMAIDFIKNAAWNSSSTLANKSARMRLYCMDGGSAVERIRIGNTEVVFNEQGHVVDNRFEGDTDQNLLMVKAATDRVGIGESSPDYKLDVNGAFGFTPGSSVTPVDNGDVVFELTNNTTLTIKAKGSDGTVRSGTVTLV